VSVAVEEMIGWLVAGTARFDVGWVRGALDDVRSA
jgi:hypothetical protein